MTKKLSDAERAIWLFRWSCVFAALLIASFVVHAYVSFTRPDCQEIELRPAPGQTYPSIVPRDSSECVQMTPGACWVFVEPDD